MLSAKRFFIHLRILCVLCFALITLNSFAGGCPQATITVQIFTDDFPGETSWELRNASTNALIASDDLFGLLTGTLYFWEVCVPHNTCFTFTIFDNFGDGICCSEGNGFYNILVNGNQVATGGAFLSSQTVNNICTPPQTSGSCTASCNGGSAPVNDDCFGSINLGALIAPNSCSSITNPGQGTAQNFNGSNLCANAEFPYTYIAGCQTGGDMAAPAADVWYRFTITGSVLAVEITGNLAGVSIGIYEDEGGGCGNLLPRGCAESPFSGNLNATFNTLGSGTYYLQVSGRDTLDECTFNIKLTNNSDCNACIIGHNMTATPPPSNGRYRSGTTVRFCYTVDNYNQAAVNWLHGVVPVFGTGWDMSTLTAFAVPSSCDGNGSWSWHPNPVTGTSPFAITSVGPGFFYESNQGCPTDIFGLPNCNTSNPGDNYGDNNPSNLCDWTFCFTITTKASCPPGQQGEDLSIEMFNYGDSETGSWNQQGCTTDPNYQFFANLFCCDTFTLAINNVSCFGGTDGSCTVQGGGQSPWDYELQNLQGSVIGVQNNDSNSHTFTGLAAGDYVMVVTDDNFCSDTRQFRVGQPDSIAISALVANVSCSGAGDGSITVTVTGGVTPYSFLWSPGGQTTEDLTGLSAGTYTVTVTDADQCSNSRSFTITEPAPLAGLILTNDVSCSGGNDGSASVVVSGGTSPYNYLWDRGTPVGNGSSVINLSAGLVTVVISDANGCLRTLIAQVNESQSIPVTPVAVNVCLGEGTPGIFYDTLTTSNGCDSIIETTVSVLPIFLNEITANICDGDSVFAGGGFQTTPGVYFDTLTASNGCDSVIQTTITISPSIFVSTSIEICDGESVFVGGALQTQPGLYYDTIQLASGCDSITETELIVLQAFVTNLPVEICDGDSYFAGGADQTVSGTYFDTVGVANGCDSIIITELTVNPNPQVVVVAGAACLGQPSQLTNLSTGVDAGAIYYVDFLSDGSFEIVAPAFLFPADTFVVIPFAGVFPFTVVVVNGTGCSDTLNSFIAVNNVPELSFTYEPGCEGGTATVTNTSTGVDAGATYYFDIDNDGTVDITVPASSLPVDSSFILTGTGSVTLNVVVLNSTGCSDTLVATFTTPENPELSFTYEPGCEGGTATVTNTSTGVDAGATYYFDIDNDGNIDITVPASSLPVDSSFVLTNSGSVTLSVVVVNSTGCSDTLVATFTTPENPELSFTYEPSCEGGTATVTNTSTGVDAGATYYFDIDNDGSIDITAPASSLPVDSSFVLTNSGSVTLRVIVVNPGGCSDTLVATFDTPEKPELAFTSDTVCLGQPTNLSNLSTGVDAGAIYYLDFFNDGTIDITAPASEFPAGDTTLTFPIPGENIFTAVVVNSTGCSDTLVGYIVIKSPVPATNVLASICDGESIFVGGDFQTQPGFYNDVLTASNGCDSVVTTELIVLPLSNGTTQVSICDGDSYFVGGGNQTQGGFYIDTLTGSNGCDSILTTELILITPTAGTTQVSICDGDSYFVEGGNQTQAGFYVDTLTGSNGCDSILTTELIVLPNSGSAQSFDVCSGDGIFAGGVFQTTSGTYFDTLAAANGCDSIITTNLNVGAPLSVDFDVRNISCGCTTTTGSGPVPDSTCSLNFAGLAHGTILNSYFASLGVSISANASGSFPDKLIVFNTNVTGSADPDLEAGIGNIAIMPDNITDSNGDGLVDSPNDNNLGGVITFEFDNPKTLYSFVFVDNDRNGGTVKAYDVNNVLIATVTTPSLGAGTVQTVTLNIPGVKKFTVSYNDSRGITDIRFSCPSQVPVNACELDINALAHGTIITSQLAGDGVTITGDSYNSAQRPDTVAIFNSNLTGTLDPDLEVGIGNLFVLPENLTDNNGDGLIDNLSDASVGGVMIFTFDRDRTVYSITLVDNDRNNGTIRAYDQNNTLLLSVTTPSGGASSIQVYNLNVSGVRRLEVDYRDSRGVTDLILDCPPQTCCDGNATANVSGGFPPYQYSWSTGSISDYSGDSLCVGTYYVTITDQLGCSTVDSVSIIQSDANYTDTTAAICEGDTYFAGGADQTESGTYYDTLGTTNGCLDILVTELTVASSFNETVQVEICQGQSHFAGGALQTESGTYVDVFSAAGGCDSTVTTELTVNPATTSNTSVEICLGDSIFAGGAFQTTSGTYTDSTVTPEGCVNIVITELIVNPSYSNTVQAEICSGDSIFAGGAFQTTSGTYTDVFATSEGCDSIITTELTVSTSLTENVSVSICNGDSYFAGGALQTQAGIYADTFASSSGCDSIVITDLFVSLINITQQSQVNASCFGTADGVIEVTVDGGVALYDLIWTDGTVTQGVGEGVLTGLNGLTAGQYGVTVTDNIACVAFANFAITEPSPLALGALATPVSCPGFSDGAIDLVVLGGIPFYTYAWSSGETTEDINGIEAATYTVIVTDANGCSATLIVLVTEPAPLETNIQAAICEGESYFAGGALQTIAGTYTDTYTSSNGCDSVVITDLTVLPASSSTVDLEICQGDSVFAGGAFQTTSGTYADTIATSNGCDSIVTTNLSVLSELLRLVQVDICEGESYFAGGGLQTTSGTYFDTLTSSSGCDSVVITTLLVSPQMNLSLDVIDVSCFGASDGQIDLSVSGGTAPFNYSWSNGQTTEDVTGLNTGLISVTVTDAIGCSATANATVTQPQPLALGATTVPASCAGGSDGSINLLVLFGTAPYTYLWSTGETTEDISGLPAGQYSVQVTDNNGCVANVIVIVSEPAAIILTATITNESLGSDGAIDLSVSGGASPYSYDWSNGSTTEDISNLTAGSYTVTVTDDNGCTAVETFTITFLPPRLSTKPKKFNGNVNVEAYPVPFLDFLIVEHNSFTKGEAIARVRDILGRIVKEERLTLQKGNNKHVLKMDSGLLNGIYMLELESTDQMKAVKVIMK